MRFFIRSYLYFEAPFKADALNTNTKGGERERSDAKIVSKLTPNEGAGRVRAARRGGGGRCCSEGVREEGEGEGEADGETARQMRGGRQVAARCEPSRAETVGCGRKAERG